MHSDALILGFRIIPKMKILYCHKGVFLNVKDAPNSVFDENKHHKMRNTLLTLALLLLSFNILLAQDCSQVSQEQNTLVSLFKEKGFLVKTSKEMRFISGNEVKEKLSLTGGKQYVLMMVTEKMIDQSGISLLNSFGFIVSSTFKETGNDRHLILIEYKPTTSADFIAAFKMIDFAGRTVCGFWTLFEK